MFIFEQITVYLEQRIYKELRAEQYGFEKVVMLIYRGLLVSYKGQMSVLLPNYLFAHVTNSIRLFVAMNTILVIFIRCEYSLILYLNG